ncbi:esterase E4-like [Anoplophora glabripennis]|uniref:esterase E4-like n=1 Tax=Anoplophora glabripennis TaxID=217634 RepID=UPI000873D143|nr:esterase E4-like [Anoplophora glabripennis]
MKLLLIYLLLLLTFVQIILSWEHKQFIPLYNTNYGSIYGSIEVARTGRLFYSFKGIPYAKPPINNLRFKAPEPPEKWEGVLDATQDGPVCIQKNYFFANPVVEGQEDCLYLNVYTHMPGYQNYQGQLLPVMVFIHWGGFFAGRGTSDYLGPEYLLEKDVVLVTFNYRLGVLGFLTTLDDEAPGNYAFKDQVAALRWVQENIHFFGGDKSKVTIFGQSAGGGSTHLHMISPLSKGLFRGVISQSGSALALWATPSNEAQKTVLAAQAKFVNCDGYIGNSSKIIECLRKVPAQDLVESQDLFKTFFVDPLTAYTSVTETLTETNPEPFITKLPIEYIQANEFSHVPWIIGVVQDEGILKASALLRQSVQRETLNNNFPRVLSDLLLLSASTTNPQSLYNDITEYFLNNKSYVDVSDAQSVQGLINLYTDRAFSYSTYQSAVLQSTKGHQPIWFYNFDYRGLYSYGNLFSATLEDINFDWGVSHCDDLLYLFNSPGLIPPLVAENDICVSEVIINLWTNFAIYGDPNPLENPALEGIDWKPLDIKDDDKNKNDKLCFLNFTGSYIDQFHVTNQCGFHKDRMSFWAKQDLFENIPGVD